jgi:hypothetical protein
MNSSLRTMPILAVIAVAALSGALTSAIIERAAIAATAPSAQDPQLTTLLKYVAVDSAGNVTIKGGNLNIQSTGNLSMQNNNLTIASQGTVTIKAGTGATVQGGTTLDIKGGATTSVTGPMVSINGAATTAIQGAALTLCCPKR